MRSLSFIELLSAMWLQSQNAGQGEGQVEARDRTADNFRTTSWSEGRAGSPAGPSGQIPTASGLINQLLAVRVSGSGNLSQ